MEEMLLKGVTFSQKEEQKFLFIIGVSNYVNHNNAKNGWGKLNNAKRDAVAIGTLLQNNYGFREESTYELYNEQVTRKNIFNTFKKLQQAIASEDSLVIYYSGHGYLSMDYEGNPIDGAWIPFDADFEAVDQHFTNTDLKRELDKIRAKHVLVLADACHSGALISGKIKGISSVSNLKLYATPSRQAFCSGRTKDKVSDGPKGGHSPFAEAIIVVLKQAKEYCFLEFVTKVRAEVNRIYEKLKMNIEPTHGWLEIPNYNNDYQGEFVFFPQKRVLGAEYQQWKFAKNQASLRGYREYLEQYPNGRYIEEAQGLVRIQKRKRAWFFVLALLLLIIMGGLGQYIYRQQLLEQYRSNISTAQQALAQSNPNIDKAIEQLNEAIETNMANQDSLSTSINKLKSYQLLLAKGDSCLNQNRLDEEVLQQAIFYYEKAWMLARNQQINPTVINQKLAYSRSEINQYLQTSFIDVRDGQSYPIVRMGGQEWMAKNLNYKSEKGSYCYNNEIDNGVKFGRLYTWTAAKNACPAGWNMPNNEAWVALATIAGGYYDVIGDEHIGSPQKAYQELMNKEGFAGELGGYRAVDGAFEYLNRRGRYWSLDEFNAEDAYFFSLSKDSGRSAQNTGDKANARSCRCVRPINKKEASPLR